MPELLRDLLTDGSTEIQFQFLISCEECGRVWKAGQYSSQRLVFRLLRKERKQFLQHSIKEKKKQESSSADFQHTDGFIQNT